LPLGWRLLSASEICRPTGAPDAAGGRSVRRSPVYLMQFLLLAAFLFCVGVYGVLARKNAVLVLMSVELILNSVNINLIALGVYRGYDEAIVGQVFALFVIAVAAAEVGIGLAIVLLIYRNRADIDLTQVDLMKG
jgi:NADH:ubiquinone oxidoreductase subunit K